MMARAVWQTPVTSPLEGEVGALRAPGGGYAARSNARRLPPSLTLPRKGGGNALHARYRRVRKAV
jgi:hypothetical protein